MVKAVLYSGMGATDIVVPKIVAVERRVSSDPLILAQFWNKDRDLKHVFILRVVMEGRDKPLEFYDPSEAVMEEKRRELSAAIEAYWDDLPPDIQVQVPLDRQEIISPGEDVSRDLLESHMDWEKAKRHFDYVEQQYKSLEGMRGVNVAPALAMVFKPLAERYEAGERTRELYDEMMKVE